MDRRVCTFAEGHIRQQAHGLQHSERKQIFVNPMWISYVPPDDETTPAQTFHR
jgi:hypothetical protein